MAVSRYRMICLVLSNYDCWISCLVRTMKDTCGTLTQTIKFGRSFYAWSNLIFTLFYEKKNIAKQIKVDEFLIQEILWSIRGSCWAIWSNPLTNVKWHSDPWPTVTSLPIRLSTNFMTFIPSLTFTELWVVSMEHLQRVWLASRERLPFRTPSSVPHFGTC